MYNCLIYQQKIMNEYEVAEIKTWTGLELDDLNWTGRDNATDFTLIQVSISSL